jgi:ER membrane protein complex subunit 2
MDLPSALQRLATYRVHNSRASQEVFETGLAVLKNHGSKLGDEGCSPLLPLPNDALNTLQGWDFLEQLALASLDVGRLDIADVGPSAPLHRVEILVFTAEGVDVSTTANGKVSRFSARRMPSRHQNRGRRAQKDGFCVLSPAARGRRDKSGTPMALFLFPKEIHPMAPQAIWKRKISLLRRTGAADRAANELRQLLDVFYTDVEGWLELADIYSSCNQYADRYARHPRV